ncbi:MAG TPA: CARDB domain-containing protein [Xanthomonadales bacterium]|nr:CARDB domain-containing protein [Xanthomonadales bacterium]
MSAYGVGGGSSGGGSTGGGVSSGKIVAGSVIDRGSADDRPEFQLFEGPNLSTSADLDPAVDINLTVRAPGGVPLQNAIVIASAGEGTIVEGKVTGPTTGRTASARSAYRFRGPSQFREQVDEHDFVQTQFGCPETLERQYTNAQGHVEFNLRDPLETSDLGGNGFVDQLVTKDCDNICGFEGPGQQTPIFCCNGTTAEKLEFEIQVRTLHLGYGRYDRERGAEIPYRFKVVYFLASERIEITNLQTGAVTEHTTSANIFADVPRFDFPGFGTPALISDVLMDYVPQTGFDNGTRFFGPFFDASAFGAKDVAVSFFASNPPTRKLRFFHDPTATGSLRSARLEFNHGAFAGFSLPFTRVNDVVDCDALGATEQYQLTLPQEILLALRFSALFSNNSAPLGAWCGEIDIEDVNDRRGVVPICFHWQQPPARMFNYDSILVDDINPFHVVVTSDGQQRAAASTQSPDPGDYGIGARRNDTMVSEGLFETFGPSGTTGAVPAFVNGFQQFSKTPPPVAEGMSVQPNVTVNFGDPNPQVLIDESIPVFQWYWGVPEVLSIDLSANLGLLATYEFNGSVRYSSSGAADTTIHSDATFGVFVPFVADIDILFGVLFDAGAQLTPGFTSSMPLDIRNGDVSGGPCFTFNLTFSAFLDVCNLCPWDTEINYFDEILRARDGAGCPANKSGFDALIAKADPPEAIRAQLRNPAVGFDTMGNGQVLALDGTRALAATRIVSGEVDATLALSQAANIRTPAVGYFAADRALAVWAESAASAASLASMDAQAKGRQQRLAYAVWNGSAWSAKQFLTSPGNGEGHVKIAVCPEGQAGCPAAGEAFVVWQHNQSGVMNAPRMKLRYARFDPAAGTFSAITTIDSLTQSINDITPSAVYAGSTPVVAWVRAGASLADTAARRLAYRFIGVAATQVSNDLPAGIAQPSLHAIDFDSLRLAYTLADAGQAFAGSHQALHIARAQCTSGVCTWAGQKVRDADGRAIYGERPSLVTSTGIEPTVVFRATRFGTSAGGAAARATDPIGVATGSGDLIAVQPSFNSGTGRFRALTADGSVHFQPVAAFNPMSGEIVAVSAPKAVPQIARVAGLLGKKAEPMMVAQGSSKALGSGIMMHSAGSMPDLAFESVTSTVSTTTGGQTLPVTVRVGNRGATYSASEGAVTMEFRWDRVAAPAITSPIASIAGGSSRTQVVNVPIPAGYMPDEPHALSVVLVVPEEVLEADTSNNESTLELGALPVPFELMSELQPGSPFVNINWQVESDPRVAGYRIYFEDALGELHPLGSTSTTGFLDFAATFDVARTYRVASYSARGVESGLSDPIQVMPVESTIDPTAPPAGADPLFLDGFE